MELELFLLLVDDDEDEYFLLKETLREMQTIVPGVIYHLDWASDYDSALSNARSGRYDLYLVDYYLGSRTGLEWFQNISQEGSSTPAILLTGQGSYDLDLRAMQVGISEYLLKDQLTPFILERSIRYTLERAKTRDELEDRVQERTEALAATNRELNAEIHRRQQIQEALQVSEERFRVLAETTSAVILIIDGENKIQYANPAARFVFGFEPDDMLGRVFTDLVHPNYHMIFQPSDMEENWVSNRFEIKVTKRDGEERWVDVTFGMIKFADEKARIMTIFDITEREIAEQELRVAKSELEKRVEERTAQLALSSKRAQQAAHEASARANELDAVIHAIPLAVIIYNEHGVPILANPATLQLFGFNPVRMDQQDIVRQLNLRHQDGSMVTLENTPFSWATQGQTVTGRRFIMTSSGRDLTLLVNASPIINDQKLTGAVMVMTDITEREQLLSEINALYKATTALVQTLDLNTLLTQILDAAQSAIPAAEKGRLFLLIRETGELEVRAEHNYSDSRISRINPRFSKEVAVRAVTEKHSIMHHTDVGERGYASEIVSPLMSGDHVLGALSLISTRDHAFSESDLNLLTSFAAATTAAIHNAMLHAEVQRLAITDVLTGLYNRRGFMDVAERELERANRYHSILSIIMMDIDKFKEINDTHGHAIGDRVLTHVAAHVRSVIRSSDTIGRLGGDEFAILLPETEPELAFRIGQRIVHLINNYPLVAETGPIPITLSLGVTRALTNTQSLGEVLTRADEALYRAKRNGRNRIEQT